MQANLSDTLALKTITALRSSAQIIPKFLMELGFVDKGSHSIKKKQQQQQKTGATGEL